MEKQESDFTHVVVCYVNIAGNLHLRRSLSVLNRYQTRANSQADGVIAIIVTEHKSEGFVLNLASKQKGYLRVKLYPRFPFDCRRPGAIR